MQLEDQLKLKTLIESALAESVAALKPGPPTPKAPSVYRLPAGQEWALASLADSRAVLTDRAVKALGGTSFVVTVGDSGVTITAVAATPHSSPTAQE